MDKNKLINETRDCIASLFAKYENDPYMLSKIHNYVVNLLPNILDKKKASHEESVQRIEALSQEQNTFIETFLNTNKYFYLSSTEKFFYYDGLHYQIISEDDILYNVLSTITKDRNLMSWKQMTKVYIMKRIKQNNLLKSVPESDTIQFVLDNLCPAIFASKVEAKYFLTILGDNMLRKNMGIIHFIDAKSKKFLRELNVIVQSTVGHSIIQTFKYKYHEQHDYKDCRLVKINECVRSDVIWVPVLNQCFLDLICVAAHYSIRFGCSDDVILKHYREQQIIDGVFYLRDTNPEGLIDKFMDEYLQFSTSSTTTIISVEQRTTQYPPGTQENNNSFSPRNPITGKGKELEYPEGAGGGKGYRGHEVASTLRREEPLGEPGVPPKRTTQITWKNMQYLWKHFLESKHLPTVMFQQRLKGYLINKMKDNYTESQDTFVNVCSKFLPAIQQFLNFWTDTIEYDNSESEFEIEDLVHLFYKWADETPGNLNDKQILDLVLYYYPDVEIEKDKYITGIRCKLWDKQLDIQVALESLRENVRGKLQREHGDFSRIKHISIYDAYTYYCKYFSCIPNKRFVNKSYFEKYVFENLIEYILDEKFIRSDWLLL